MPRGDGGKSGVQGDVHEDRSRHPYNGTGSLRNFVDTDSFFFSCVQHLVQLVFIAMRTVEEVKPHRAAAILGVGLGQDKERGAWFVIHRATAVHQKVLHIFY